ncbi:MAG: hypothetical protein ABEJ68_11970 [Halobacteriaceae archaeon]
MPVPGYDPADVEDALRSKLDETDTQEVLTDEERAAYRNDDASLVDLLDDDQIARILDDRVA